MLSKLRQLARTAHQEDSPPRKPGFLRPPTGAGKLPGTLPGSIKREQGPERVGQGHRVAKNQPMCTVFRRYPSSFVAVIQTVSIKGWRFPNFENRNRI